MQTRYRAELVVADAVQLRPSSEPAPDLESVNDAAAICTGVLADDEIGAADGVELNSISDDQFLRG